MSSYRRDLFSLVYHSLIALQNPSRIRTLIHIEGAIRQDLTNTAIIGLEDASRVQFLKSSYGVIKSLFRDRRVELALCIMKLTWRILGES